MDGTAKESGMNVGNKVQKNLVFILMRMRVLPRLAAWKRKIYSTMEEKKRKTALEDRA